MLTFWEKFSEFWQAYGPWIGASLIPTLVVGLSVSPKTEEAAGIIQKVWDFVKMALDFLSVATHKDKPGTFQLPLKADALLKKAKNRSTEAGLVLFLVGATAGYSSMGCVSWFKEEGGKVKTVAIDCSIASVKENASQLVPALVGILTGGSVNWKEQVKVFVKEFGQDATSCAMQAAINRLQDPISSEPIEDPAAAAAEGAAKGQSYINEQGWKYAD